MASDVRPSHQTARQARAIPNPGQLQTSNLTRNPRYSYLETPVEMQGATFHQFSSPANSIIDESPISPRSGHTNPHQGTIVNGRTPTLNPPGRTGSPYGFPAPQQVHPAYFAPYSEDLSAQKPHQTQYVGQRGSPEVVAPENHEDLKSPAKESSPQVSLDRKEDGQPQLSQSPTTSRETQFYAPDSFGGPNGVLENHRPGQVAHPNSAIDPQWKNGLCDPDATCCLSLFCPCIIYGRTQYRLSKKAQKQDPTDLLGYEACNGSCGFMAIACGFQCTL